MLCCLTGALLAGNVVAAGGATLARRRLAALVFMGIAVAAGIAVAPLLAEHAGHYAARAEANHRSVLEEILAAPLCTGGVEA